MHDTSVANMYMHTQDYYIIFVLTLLSATLQYLCVELYTEP